jgi:hypothetical protein
LRANSPLDFPHLQVEPKEELMKTLQAGITLPAFVLAVALLLPSIALAQQDKGQWYVFGAGGGQTGTGGVQVGGGIGHEWLLYKGLGLGVEGGGYGGSDARAVVSANGSYHFRQSASQKLVPFGTGGVSGLFACGDGCGAAGAFNFGGGINYWFRPNRGLRLEGRDYVLDKSDHKWEIRVGFAF